MVEHFIRDRIIAFPVRPLPRPEVGQSRADYNLKLFWEGLLDAGQAGKFIGLGFIAAALPIPGARIIAAGLFGVAFGSFLRGQVELTLAGGIGAIQGKTSRRN